MGYLTKIWIPAAVAVVNGHADQGLKLRSGLKSFHQCKNRFSSAAGSGGAAAAVVGSGFVGEGERRRDAEENLRQVMYFDCWGRG